MVLFSLNSDRILFFFIYLSFLAKCCSYKLASRLNGNWKDYFSRGRKEDVGKYWLERRWRYSKWWVQLQESRHSVLLCCFSLQFQVMGSLHLGKCIVRNYSVFVLSILEIGSYTAGDQLLGARGLNWYSGMDLLE